tara:strand:- start:2115 stop:2417 length:303 start_codon:yes stop_codon:yes gene_type:complete
MADKSIIIETPDGEEWAEFPLENWAAIEKWVFSKTKYDGDFYCDIEDEEGVVFYRCADTGEKTSRKLFTYRIEEAEKDACGCSSYFCPCSGTKSYSSAWL